MIHPHTKALRAIHRLLWPERYEPMEDPLDWDSDTVQDVALLVGEALYADPEVPTKALPPPDNEVT